MIRSLKPKITESIDRAIADFSLFDRDMTIAVAVSGGKDSVLLALALRELEYAIRPLVVDMGYERGWSGRIRDLLGRLGLDAQYVDVRSPDALIEPLRIPARRTLRILNSVSDIAKVTPCTACYNSKVFAFESALSRMNINAICFGHHLTDACTSLIKESLMTIDRWSDNHTVYNRTNFVALVEELLAECQDMVGTGRSGRLMNEIDKLTRDGLVDTDEPPRQYLMPGSSREVVRPLFYLDERQIKTEVERLGLHTEGSGCGHGATVQTMTPREVVQHKIFDIHSARRFESTVITWIMRGIDHAGRGTAGARRERATRLGERYKPDLGENKM